MHKLDKNCKKKILVKKGFFYKYDNYKTLAVLNNNYIKVEPTNEYLKFIFESKIFSWCT